MGVTHSLDRCITRFRGRQAIVSKFVDQRTEAWINVAVQQYRTRLRLCVPLFHEKRTESKAALATTSVWCNNQSWL